MSRFCQHRMVWGRCPRCSSSTAAELIRQDLYPTLITLYQIFDVGAFLRPVKKKTREVEYAPRTWADLHLEQLGWGLVASIFALVGVIAWILQ